MQIPYFLGEFGACMDSDDCVREIQQATDVADKTLAGWAYWQFKTYKDPTTTAGDRSEGFYNKDGSIQGKKVRMLARTSIMAAQGKILEQHFNSTTGAFTADFKVDASIDAPTIVQTLKTSVHGEPVWYNDDVAFTVSVDGKKLDNIEFNDAGLNKKSFKLGPEDDGKVV